MWAIMAAEYGRMGAAAGAWRAGSGRVATGRRPGAAITRSAVDVVRAGRGPGAGADGARRPVGGYRRGARGRAAAVDSYAAVTGSDTRARYDAAQWKPGKGQGAPESSCRGAIFI